MATHKKQQGMDLWTIVLFAAAPVLAAIVLAEAVILLIG